MKSTSKVESILFGFTYNK